MGSILYFSIISIFMNFFIFVFFLAQPTVLAVLTTYSLGFLLVLFILTITCLFIRVNTFAQFFGISSLVTLLNLACMLMLG